jgi:hypothetical protein
MRRTRPQFSRKNNQAAFQQLKKNEDIPVLEPPAPRDCSMSDQLISFQTYKEITDATNQLLHDITIECNRRINKIFNSVFNPILHFLSWKNKSNKNLNS